MIIYMNKWNSIDAQIRLICKINETSVINEHQKKCTAPTHLCFTIVFSDAHKWHQTECECNGEDYATYKTGKVQLPRHRAHSK